MSTTTVGDLLDRAELLARALRVTRAEITADQWRSFDATSYRLLHELVGPERTGNHEQIVSHATVSRILNGYPSPLSAPNPQATYNARQAASHLGVSRATVAADIRGSRLPATYDGRRYSIKATDLPSITEVQPADPASTHPLDRLSCTLGVLADMVVAERSRTTNIPGLDPLRDDAQVAPVMARVLAMTVVAARHALAHIPLQDADRPLAIARYAERSLDAIGDVGRTQQSHPGRELRPTFVTPRAERRARGRAARLGKSRADGTGQDRSQHGGPAQHRQPGPPPVCRERASGRSLLHPWAPLRAGRGVRPRRTARSGPGHARPSAAVGNRHHSHQTGPRVRHRDDQSARKPVSNRARDPASG